jgi:hypothetical protein
MAGNNDYESGVDLSVMTARKKNPINPEYARNDRQTSRQINEWISSKNLERKLQGNQLSRYHIFYHLQVKFLQFKAHSKFDRF